MMEVLSQLERTLTQLDHARLSKLAHQGGVAGPALRDLLDTSDLVASREVAPDVVTMYSQVLLADAISGERYSLTLCYPHDAEPAAGFVSVLSPVGASLLGARVGATVRWTAPGGQTGAAELVGLQFQPEASGDYLI